MTARRGVAKRQTLAVCKFRVVFYTVNVDAAMSGEAVDALEFSIVANRRSLVVAVANLHVRIHRVTVIKAAHFFVQGPEAPLIVH